MIKGAFSNLARRPALWAGSFSYNFLQQLYEISPVRHLLDWTELVAYAATYFGFQKASACVVFFFYLIDLPTYLFVHPEDGRADVDDRGIPGMRAEGRSAASGTRNEDDAARDRG